MGSNTPETHALPARVHAADTVEKLKLTTQARRQGLALAMGLTGLTAAMLIALFGR